MSEIVSLGKAAEIANEITGGEPRITNDKVKLAITEGKIRGGNLDGGPWEIEADSVRVWASSLIGPDAEFNEPKTALQLPAIKIRRGIFGYKDQAEFPHASAKGHYRPGQIIETPTAAEFDLLKAGYARLYFEAPMKKRRR